MLIAYAVEGDDRPPSSSKTGRKMAGGAFSGRLGGEKALISSRFETHTDVWREQNIRENNRTITGAYQGDIRRANRTIARRHNRPGGACVMQMAHGSEDAPSSS
jgi:hypothetical protein